jgi:hypothetical protein
MTPEYGDRGEVEAEQVEQSLQANSMDWTDFSNYVRQTAETGIWGGK